MHEKGKFFEENLEEAVRLYHLAAAQNHAGALFQLGYMYEEGKGVPSNKEKAQEYLRGAVINGWITS